MCKTWCQMKVWLKREVGANPTLSRNCNSEQITNATGETGKAVRRVDEKPGDLPISSTRQIPTWK